MGQPLNPFCRLLCYLGYEILMLEPYGLNGIRVRVTRLPEIKQELFLRGKPACQ
jgi:hypothetical protein